MIVFLLIVITYKISYQKVLSAKTVGSCCRLEDLVIRHHSEGTSMLNTLHKSLTIAILAASIFISGLSVPPVSYDLHLLILKVEVVSSE